MAKSKKSNFQNRQVSSDIDDVSDVNAEPNSYNNVIFGSHNSYVLGKENPLITSNDMIKNQKKLHSLEELLYIRNSFDVEFNKKVMEKVSVLYEIMPSYFTKDIYGNSLEVNPYVEGYLEDAMRQYEVACEQMDAVLKSVDWLISRELKTEQNKNEVSKLTELETRLVSVVYTHLERLKKYAFKQLDNIDFEHLPAMINN